MNEVTFLSLLEDHQGIIHKICRLYRDQEEDQQDLFQEIIYQVWRARDSYRAEAKWTTWLYRIALNTALASFRKRKAPVDFLEQLPDSPIIEEEDVHARVFRLLRTLSDADKALISLSLDDLSYQEIADITGLSVNAVGIRLTRIKKKLKKNAEQHGI